MNTFHPCRRFLLILTVLCFVISSAQAQITSTFDADADGWTAVDINQSSTQPVNFNGTAGNPGGFVSSTISTSQPYYWLAPAKFIGNIAYRSYGETLSFDLQVSNTTGQVVSPYGDILLVSTSNNVIAMSLTSTTGSPGLPVLAPGWSHYSVKLDETAGWKQGSIGGATASREYLLGVLSSLASIRIHVQYKFATSITGGLDNVRLNVHPVAPLPPSITSFSPLKGEPGSSVTINGNNFGNGTAQNAVLFGGMKALITNASATQLTVTVPYGAHHAQLSVMNLSNGLSGKSAQTFIPIFSDNADATILRSSLAAPVTFNNQASYLATGDVDGDGKNDIVTAYSGFISIFRNTSTSGIIDANSLAPRIDLTPSAAYGYAQLELADVDSDGKLDILVAIRDNPDQGRVVVLRNNSTPGTITAGSFDPFLDVTLPPYTLSAVHIVDLDLDGRPEIVSWGSSCAANPVYVSQNISIPGNIIFAAAKAFTGLYTCGPTFSSGDLDGDGKPELIQNADAGIGIFRNTSTMGVISFEPVVNIGAAGSVNITVCDMDGDNKPDLIYTSIYQLKIRKNQAVSGTIDTNSFAGETIMPGGYFEAKIADMNGDGRPDVVTGTQSYMGVFENIGTDGAIDPGSFRPIVLFETTAPAAAIEVVDFDNDGKPDVLVNNSSSGTISIFHNQLRFSPVVTSLSTTTAQPGASLTITGDHFSTNLTDNIVRIGPVLATVTTASETSLIVTVPPGAGSGHVTVSCNGLTGQSPEFFNPAFSGGADFSETSFEAAVDFTVPAITDGLIANDFDDDGYIDLISTIDGSQIGILHNTGATGISTSSFDAIKTITVGNAFHVEGGDIDGDGKVDLFVSGSVVRNISNTALPTPITFDGYVSGANGGVNRFSRLSDLNQDGKLDLIYTTSLSTVTVNENISRPGPFVQNNSVFGSINTVLQFSKAAVGGYVLSVDLDGDSFNDIVSTNPATDNITILRNNGLKVPLTTAQFTSGQEVATGDNPVGLASADFDGDGKPDLVVTNAGTPASLSVFRNTSTLGNISFARQDFISAAGPEKIVTADMDGDGKPDIVVINIAAGVNSFSVFRNKSTSGVLNANSFAPKADYATVTSPRALAIADIDNDMRPDVIIARIGTNVVSIFRNIQPIGPVINIVQQPAASLSVCEGATISLSVQATGASNLTYQWQLYNTSTLAFENIPANAIHSNATTSSLTITGITAGMDGNMYRVQVSGDNASNKESHNITLTTSGQPEAPEATGASTCQAASVVLSASGGTNGNYRWFNSPTAAQHINDAVNETFETPVLFASTTFYVAIINETGCLSERIPAVAAITTLPKPSISSNGTLLCGSNTITISGPAGYAGYRWSNGATTQNIEAAFVGNYALIVEDVSGCSSLPSDAITITSGSVPKPVISSSKTQLCAATDQAILSGPAGFAVYNWSNGESTSTITVTTAGSYTLTVENASGCVSEVSNALVIGLGAEKPVISVGDDVLVSSPAVAYQWYFAGSAIPGAAGQSQFLSYNPLQYGIYKVVATDASGCVAESDDYANLVTGVEMDQELLVYPNPFNDVLHIPVHAKYAELFDLTGRSILALQAGENNVSHLPKGIYLLRIQTANAITTQKLSK